MYILNIWNAFDTMVPYTHERVTNNACMTVGVFTLCTLLTVYLF